MLNFTTYSVHADLALFGSAAIVVWFAGTHLVRFVDAIADKTGIGQSLGGMLLLGGITASPEIAAISDASWIGNAPLSTGNLLGSVCVNLLLICLADAVLGREPITSIMPGPATLLQGVIVIVALALTAAAIVVGDAAVDGVGLWSVTIFLFVIFGMWLASRYAKHSPWRAHRARHLPGASHQTAPHPSNDLVKRPLFSLVVSTVLLGIVILAAGCLLSQAANAFAHQTGYGSSFIGLVGVSFATALPEASSIVAAVRMERYEMALSDVFGSNLFNLGLFLLGDALYAGGPILNQAGRFEVAAALLGMLMTSIYLLGLLERNNRKIFGMGYDSVAVILVYIGGLACLYHLG